MARGPTSKSSHDGGCACGQVRFRLEREPMFVHACHCTRCQRETGGPFAHHAMIEFSAFTVTAGEAEFVKVPTDSGNAHWVARCPACRTAMWNEHGARRNAVTRYVRVGTLDEPNRLPPRAHIYVRSKQPWLELGAAIPAFKTYYDPARTWPAEGLARYAAAKALRAAQAAAEKAAKATKAAKTAKAAGTAGASTLAGAGRAMTTGAKSRRKTG
ncbi:MAG: GFA family protein [Rubrivivax sp.]|nr:GFA family protein [Rubrivivax sp.]